MVNSIGLQNGGLERFLGELDGYDVGLPLFVSLAADTAGEFAEACGRLAKDGRVSAVELNLSCPNVEHGGAQFCSSSRNVEEVVAVCRGALGHSKPMLVKLAFEGAVANALAAEAAGADALTVMNTVPALVVDAHERRVFLRGGLSGPAVKPIALHAVFEVSRAVRVPVVGCGGVASGTDVAEFMIAGASAVMVGSGSFARGPVEMLGEFEAYLRQAGLSARDLTPR
jgi:dihydroorotate dehydrogenase (NAD+) catalytic subunit